MKTILSASRTQQLAVLTQYQFCEQAELCSPTLTSQQEQVAAKAGYHTSVSSNK